MRQPTCVVVTALLALSSPACARPVVQLEARDPTRPTRGRVEIRHQAVREVSFRIAVEHAAAAADGTAGRVLVVWIREHEDRPPRNVGPLTMLWPEGRGQAYGTSTSPSFDVLVTVEGDLGATAPSGPVVLEGSVGRSSRRGTAAPVARQQHHAKTSHGPAWPKSFTQR